MRSPVFKIIDSKSILRPKILKRKKIYKQRKTWGLMGNDVSRGKINDLNEVLRVHKSQKAEGKNSWKLAPKDSCEVYKARLKRQSVNDRRKQGNEPGRENQENVANKTKGRKRESRTRKRKPDRRRKKRPMSDEKYISESDTGSCTCCCRSMSYSSESNSEMDCE